MKPLSRRDVLAALAAPAVIGGAAPPLRIASAVPTGRLEPLAVADQGGLLLLAQGGEFLVRALPRGGLAPMLAMRWSADTAARVWRFVLRADVRFHDGTPLTAGDAAATFKRLADSHLPSNALSVFRGVLSPDGIRAVDARTVEFVLDAPYSNFPYAVSSDNYNAVVLPAHDPSGRVGTGPFRWRSYTPGLAAQFVPNRDWWGGRVRPAGLEFLLTADQAPQVLALRAGEADIVAQFVVHGARDLIDDPTVQVLRTPSSAHRQIHLRTDRPPFSDRGLRRALAETIDREALVRGFLRGLGVAGADSPCAPAQPDTAAVPPRPYDRSLVAPGSTHATLVAPRLQEIPDLAVIVRQWMARAGLALSLTIEDTARYYGSAAPGSSDWLDSAIGITDYGHRAVPDVILRAAFGSGGPWNAARYANPAFDAGLASYLAAPDAGRRREALAGLQRTLADDVPVIVPYFFDYLVAARPGLSRIDAAPVGQLFLAQAG